MQAALAHVARHQGLTIRPGSSDPATRELALEVLGLVFQHRRLVSGSTPCDETPCPMCLAPHLERVMKAIERAEPIDFVLPAFPGKSPNPTKVLSPRADMAECQSFMFLNSLCRSIGALYAPGARIIICSDGRVFSDVVGIDERDIGLYQQDLLDLIEALGAEALTTFNLDDVFAGLSFDEMRARLMATYGQPLEALQAAVRAGGEPQQLYCGITRFLLEDATRPDMTISRSALQKDCRRRAYGVIQRSKAWDALLGERFPDAVRLSIHPQGCGSRKLGIHLMRTADGWLTPWHGVAVEVSNGFQLLKRSQAEALGAELVFDNGRPSHYLHRGSTLLYRTELR